MPWGSSSAHGSKHDADDTLPLPKGFTSIRDILDEKNARPGTLTNVCGIVKDFRLPMPTAKTGELNLHHDLSTQLIAH
jgi:hypothetical protein